jgi:hypothetical protein
MAEPVPPLKRVALAGGTGLLGRHLAEALAGRGIEVVLVTRRPEGRPNAVPWEALPAALEGADAVVNLAGEGIADRRWTLARRAALLESREGATARIVAALEGLAHRPRVLVNASAVGIYGDQGPEPVREGQEPGRGFLPEVCRRWEAAADRAGALGLRVVKLRLGVVLARDGGALPRMALPVRWFLGTPLGHGRQGLSWIHVADAAGLVLEALDNPAYEGPVDATAPGPVSNALFTRALARRLRRPVLPLPAPLTRAALLLRFGTMGREMLLEGAFVLPRRALALGYVFRFPGLDAALEDLL